MARVLLIDDDPDVLKTLVRMVASGDHVALSHIGDGSLWDSLSREQFDVVVTDIGMPVQNGVDIAHWLDMYRPGTPVVAVSGNVGHLRRSGKAPLFAATVQKPVLRQALLAAISVALAH